MKKVLIHVGFLSALLIINTLGFAFIGTGYIGKAVLLFLSSGVLAYGYVKTFEKDTPATNEVKPESNIMKDYYEFQRCRNERLKRTTTPPTAWWDGVHEMD